MANVTDPLVNQLSGSDPQNLMEYITRQKIYDSRFWKEECFGLTVSDVLEKCCTQMKTIGPLPCHCLKLALKLLQLHPEHELVQKAFVEQDEFKYARAVGCLYIRMTSRPAEIYETLEACYSDFRKLRLWQAQSQTWAVLHMDEYIHQLLTQPSSNCLGIALPRLPARRVLEEAGYLPEGPRPTALQDVLREYGEQGDDGDDSDEIHENPVLAYLKHKAFVEQSPAAIRAWEERQLKFPETKISRKKARVEERAIDDGDNNNDVPMSSSVREDRNKHDKKQKKSKKKERNYDNLFKKSNHSSKKSKKKDSLSDAPTATANQPEEGSEEYWNQERAKLGLGKLK